MAGTEAFITNCIVYARVLYIHIYCICCLHGNMVHHEHTLWAQATMTYIRKLHLFSWWVLCVLYLSMSIYTYVYLPLKYIISRIVFVTFIFSSIHTTKDARESFAPFLFCSCTTQQWSALIEGLLYMHISIPSVLHCIFYARTMPCHAPKTEAKIVWFKLSSFVVN